MANKKLTIEMLKIISSVRVESVRSKIQTHKVSYLQLSFKKKKKKERP